MKKLLPLLLALLLVPSVSLAAIAFDASGTGTANPNTQLNYNHTVTGSNTVLVVCVMQQAIGDITSVRYAGVSMTRIAFRASGGTWGVSEWGLIAPTTGTNQVGVSSTPNTAIFSSSASYTGVLQTAFSSTFEASSTNTGNSPNTSAAVTTITDNAWPVACEAGDDGTIAAGAATTMRNSASSQEAIFDSNAPKTPAGSITLNFTTNGTGAEAQTIVSIAPAAAAAATGPTTHLIRSKGRTRNNPGR